MSWWTYWTNEDDAVWPWDDMPERVVLHDAHVIAYYLSRGARFPSNAPRRLWAALG
jgi:hypothetical protein